MALKLGMLGMWHTHAHGLVRQMAAHPKEFALVGCFDRDQPPERAAPDARLREVVDLGRWGLYWELQGHVGAFSPSWALDDAQS